MRVIHSADWHLGQALHGVDREPEHASFLAWLLDQLESKAVDALLVAGDVFDVASPSSAALALYYGFLAEARERCPELSILIVGGNHDSPARLEAPAEVLRRLQIRVLGGLPAAVNGRVDLDRLLVPIGPPADPSAWVVAMPYVRPRDLPGTRYDADGQIRSESLIDAHRKLIAEAFAEARSRAGARRPILATGHCYLAGGATSDESERRIQVGYQAALPADVYPPDAAYVALGHLHRAQTVGGLAHVRYSGSPIPLSMPERTYEHQVLLIEVGAAGVESIEPLFVPRTRRLLSVPEEPAPVEDVLTQLAALAPEEAGELEPLLEVRVRLQGRDPRLRSRVESALGDAPFRLVRLSVERNASPEEPLLSAPLTSAKPQDVFRRLYARNHGGEPPGALLELFDELQHRAELESED